MTVRETISDAVNTVEGITCTPYYSQATRAGTAMVRKDQVEYPNPFGGVVTWNVVLMLPQDMAAAERFFEEKVPAIKTAIEPHLVVRSVALQQIQFPNTGTLYCALFTGHREEE